MKRILLSFLFIVFVLNTLAQQYTPMLELGKIWNMHSYSNNFDGPPPWHETNTDFSYYIEGTTMINSVEYFNLKDTRGTYVYYLREDVTSKKVYWYYANQDNLLFDFDVEVGGRFQNYYFNNQGENNFLVINIGFENIFGIETKYYDLEVECGPEYNYRIYEGIGFWKNTEYGLLREGLIDIPMSNDCFYVDQGGFTEVINMNQPLSTTNYFTQNNINLFYNSSNKQLELTNNAKDIAVEIYSVLGKKVIAEQINTSINVSQLPKGVYFYNLLKDNATKKGKILIY